MIKTEIVISWLGRRMARIRAFNFLDFSKLILFAKKNYKNCRTYDGSNPAA
jgi:hypothetical protein